MSSSQLHLEQIEGAQQPNPLEASVTNLKSLQLALPLKSPRFSTLRPVSQKLRPQFAPHAKHKTTPKAEKTPESILDLKKCEKWKKSGKSSDQRNALIRGLVTELLRHGKLKTSTDRVKAVRPCVDKIIGLAKQGDVCIHHRALECIHDKKLVGSVLDKVPARYKDRAPRLTRIKREGKMRRDTNELMQDIDRV
eukprot:g4052.t1